MTMFERLERLEARMGVLEARLLKPETVTRAAECSCDGGFDPSEPPPHDHVPCGGTGRVDVPVVEPVERWPSEDAPIGAFEAIREPLVALLPLKSPRCPCQDDGLCTRVRGSAAHPWTVEDQQSAYSRSPEFEAVERGMIPPPPPYEVRVLAETATWLQSFLNWYEGADGTTSSLYEIADQARALLARARCTEGTANVRPTTR